MRIITDHNQHDINEPIGAALGYFDGFHIGHMKIISSVLASSYAPALITFSQRPVDVINGGGTRTKKLMSASDKMEFLKDAGIKYLFIYDFSEEMMATSPEDFVRKYLAENNVRYVCAGYNYTFGAQGKGNTDTLEKLCSTYGIKTDICPPVKCDGFPVSSSLIRKCIREGNVSFAAKLLGRPFYLKGIVTEGRRIGRTIGFPTANTVVEEGLIVPAWGVYYTVTEVNGRTFRSITNIGNNPTVSGETVTIETHILDFDEDIYGETIKVEFMEFIRQEKKFASLDELKDQLKKDEAFARSR
ncbi:MAG: bifunctional riboflavin kinase/FAD synthetase [Eubacteriaceae bacterium]|nr:bifunctional riboflavin kinase/FAD synthetase [Eubacteriaceae bacterium]